MRVKLPVNKPQTKQTQIKNPWSYPLSIWGALYAFSHSWDEINGSTGRLDLTYERLLIFFCEITIVVNLYILNHYCRIKTTQVFLTNLVFMRDSNRDLEGWVDEVTDTIFDCPSEISSYCLHISYKKSNLSDHKGKNSWEYKDFYSHYAKQSQKFSCTIFILIFPKLNMQKIQKWWKFHSHFLYLPIVSKNIIFFNFFWVKNFSKLFNFAEGEKENKEIFSLKFLTQARKGQERKGIFWSISAWCWGKKK